MTDLRILVLAVVLAFGGGYFVKGQFFAAAETKELRVEAKQSARNVVQSTAASARIETAVAKTDDNVNQIKAAVIKRGITLQPKPEKSNVANSNLAGVRTAAGQPTSTEPQGGSAPACRGSDLVLDVGTVSMLDAARQGSALGAAGGSDEAQSAPSTVGVTDFVANDLDVVRMYLDLAKRHDELVDAVMERLHQQSNEEEK